MSKTSRKVLRYYDNWSAVLPEKVHIIIRDYQQSEYFFMSLDARLRGLL